MMSRASLTLQRTADDPFAYLAVLIPARDGLLGGFASLHCLNSLAHCIMPIYEQLQHFVERIPPPWTRSRENTPRPPRLSGLPLSNLGWIQEDPGSLVKRVVDRLWSELTEIVAHYCDDPVPREVACWRYGARQAEGSKLYREWVQPETISILSSAPTFDPNEHKHGTAMLVGFESDRGRYSQKLVMYSEGTTESIQRFLMQLVAPEVDPSSDLARDNPISNVFVVPLVTIPHHTPDGKPVHESYQEILEKVFLLATRTFMEEILLPRASGSDSSRTPHVKAGVNPNSFAPDETKLPAFPRIESCDDGLVRIPTEAFLESIVRGVDIHLVRTDHHCTIAFDDPPRRGGSRTSSYSTELFPISIPLNNTRNPPPSIDPSRSGVLRAFFRGPDFAPQKGIVAVFPRSGHKRARRGKYGLFYRLTGNPNEQEYDPNFDDATCDRLDVIWRAIAKWRTYVLEQQQDCDVEQEGNAQDNEGEQEEQEQDAIPFSDVKEQERAAFSGGIEVVPGRLVHQEELEGGEPVEDESTRGRIDRTEEELEEGEVLE
ncbi:hypothetical protein JCM11491_003118 [Sporobolomyces phaffii]